MKYFICSPFANLNGAHPTCQANWLKDKSGKVSTMQIPWADSLQRHSYLLKKNIDTLKATKNQSKTCSLLRVGFSLVNRIIHLSVERGLLRRVEQPYTSLSIDEKSFRKGHHYVSVLSCPQTETVINVSERRTKQVAK